MEMVRSLLMLLLCLGGCSTYELQAPEPGEEEWKPSAPLPLQAAASAEDGGLYRRDYMFTLFQDRRAYRVGDILTVMLDERTQSSKQAGTTTGKSSNINVVAPTLGTTTHNDLAASSPRPTISTAAPPPASRTPSPGPSRSPWPRCCPMACCASRGEKWIRLNQGDEYVRLGGMVRVEDIDQANRLSSQRIADARITYAGRGALADSNQAGWLGRFFNSSLFPL
jgi:flagellar L-ring protein precursor FlgH